MNQIIEVDPQVKALIFDLDGTIIDTMPLHFIAWKNTLVNYGIDFTPEIFGTLAGVPLYGTVEKLNERFGKHIDPKEAGDTKELEYENNMHKIKSVAPVVEVIKRFHGKLPMAIGTGSCRRLSQKAMKIAGIDQYIDKLVTADDVTRHKPYPDTFLRCAELMGVKPEDCLVFEDGMPGIEAAKTAGMMYVDVNQYYEIQYNQE